MINANYSFEEFVYTDLWCCTRLCHCCFGGHISCTWEENWTLFQYKDGLSRRGLSVVKRWRSQDCLFLHAKLWIPWWEIDIHGCYSLFRQFARARTIKEYDVTLPVPHNRVTSQIGCGDVAMLSQKRPSLATMTKSAIDKYFFVGSGHKIACIHSLPWITNFGLLVMRFANDFHSWLRHTWKLLANRLTRDPKIIIHGNWCIILCIFIMGIHILVSRHFYIANTPW